NDLDEDGILDDPDDYNPDDWDGPYLSGPRPDPWGNKYLALVQGMRDGEQAGGSTDVFGWVLSTGPNGKLETDDDSGELGGDDSGIMLTKS
ncbi:MAG: hypothetical protein J3T61_10700, partial [Candidatus Brocadiales bacterium]|nr:hypothetical protein [Candidatus Bathyanammoxibius sp.]